MSFRVHCDLRFVSVFLRLLFLYRVLFFFSTYQTPFTDHFCVIKINVYLLYFFILIQNIKSLPIRVCETSCRSVLQFH